MVRMFLLCFFLPFLAACSHGNVPTPAPAPSVNLLNYLEHYVDGAPLKSTDQIQRYRTDFGNYQAVVAAVQPDGSVIFNWQYPPFSTFDLVNGDGGEQYVVNNDTATIRATRDGGTPYDQYFCGGTGWVLFKSDVDSTWKTEIATLSDQESPSSCPATSYSYTQYSRQTVDFPVLGSTDTLISQHYDNISPEMSQHMEEFFFGYHQSRIAWLAFSRTPPTTDLTSRCPDFGYNNLGPGWYLNDCRINVFVNTNTVPLSESQLWHPAK